MAYIYVYFNTCCCPTVDKWYFHSTGYFPVPVVGSLPSLLKPPFLPLFTCVFRQFRSLTTHTPAELDGDTGNLELGPK